MEIVYQRCAGLDIRKKNVTACLLIADEDGQVRKEIRAYSPKTPDILEMRDWLKGAGCRHVAMETKSDHWEPIYYLLEEDFELLVVDAHYFKTVPGRPADAKDAEWIAHLVQHGVLKANYIPPSRQRELVELTSYIADLEKVRRREFDRLEKTLWDTNIKVGDMPKDISDKSFWAVLQALANGETDPRRLANLVQGGGRVSQDELERALTGKVTAQHRFMLSEYLKRIEYLDAAIERMTEQMAKHFLSPDPAAE